MNKVFILSIAASLVTINTMAMLPKLKQTIHTPKILRTITQKEEFTQQLKQNQGRIDYLLEQYARCSNSYDAAEKQYDTLKNASTFEKIPLLGQFFENLRDDNRLKAMLVMNDYSEQLNRGKKQLSELYEKRYELQQQLKKFE
ncbi:MAG TPA: hypothetical protein VKU36_00990 [Candidatus Babeliales bacterium]|nr:hypothetical protein [Candidatus Babeliales bacterium]